jgi:hypothetical protein
VTNQYQSVRESISETLDWREQFRKRPVAWSVGALSVGFMTGYCLAATFKGESGGREGYPSYEESDVWNVGAPLASAAYAGKRSSSTSGDITASSPSRSYASQAITGGSYGSTEYDEADQGEDYDEEFSTSLDRGATAKAEEPSGPSLIERFKETKAFDRLQGEVSKLGDRFIDQLSTVGHEVVLPALFGKIKELFGVDLSGQKQAGQERGGRSQAAAAGASSSSSSSSTSASSLASASRGSQSEGVSDMGGLSYGTSENRAYGGSEAARDDYGRSSDSNASDLNRNQQ